MTFLVGSQSAVASEFLESDKSEEHAAWYPPVFQSDFRPPQLAWPPEYTSGLRRMLLVPDHENAGILPSRLPRVVVAEERPHPEFSTIRNSKY